jgi:DNA invertase Pin-like site-specific DNA recombinase
MGKLSVRLEATNLQPRVYSYIRFSDEKQAAGSSLARQTGYAESVAKGKGLVLDQELKMFDAGLSAFHAAHRKRGKFGLFMEAIKLGKVTPGSVLVVEDFDRLSRQEPMEALRQLQDIIDVGVAIVTGNGMEFSSASLRKDPTALFLVLSKMITANQESEGKKRRVTDALRMRCQAFESGDRSKHVHAGGKPGWLRRVNGKWQFIPERKRAVAEAIRLFREGYGAGYIANHLAATGQRVSDSEPNSGQIVRMLTRPALMGEKRVTVHEPAKDGVEGDPHEYAFPGYFPAVIDAAQFDEIQALLASRARKAVRGTVPSLLTGTGITSCGYCGAAMKAQTMTNKMRDDGTLADGHRRLQCVRVNVGGGCSVKGSCSSAPIERELMGWLSDIGNLRSLYNPAATTSGALAVARADLAKKERGIARLMAALEEDEDQPIKEIKAQLRKARDERDALAERESRLALAAGEASRADRPDVAARWKALRTGVDALDYEARMQARQLVVDTFESIKVYHHGFKPAHSVKGEIGLLLLAKGGIERQLVINAS